MGHRYIGSKTKILDEVLDEVNRILPKGRVIDLMSGTGSVSAGLRKMGYSVTSVDLMTYSFHHSRVYLFLSKAPNFRNATDYINNSRSKNIERRNNYEEILHILNSLPGKNGYFWNEFSFEGKPGNSTKPRNYFSTDNAKKIDSIREKIKLLHDNNKINDLEHSLLLHDLIMASNDVANISGTYGHYLSKLAGRANISIKLRPTIFSISGNDKDHKVLRGYAETLSNAISGDLCYIDPPYKKRQYAANYHILETLAREDMPPAIGESGLRPWRDQYSNFCTKTKIRESFDKIFRTMKCKIFLVSYSEDGLLKIADLKSFFSKYGKVTMRAFTNKRFRSNKSLLGNTLTEYLIQIRL